MFFASKTKTVSFPFSLHVYAYFIPPLVCLDQIGQPRSPESLASSSHEPKGPTFKQILSHRNVHLMAFFILVYVGVEVTIGSWSVTYVQDKRHGGASAGYISSGFFAGLMLGRILLMWVNRKVKCQ